jgi:hypothetical protein
MWKVYAGLKDWAFEDLKKAKVKARKYEGAQIFEVVGSWRFLRFLTLNGRLLRRS